MKTALVHDWFYSITGAEKVAEEIYSLFPSRVFCLIKNEKNLKNLSILQQDITPSFIQRLPFAKEKYPYYLPLFASAIESFDLNEFDLILSSSSSIAKNVLTNSNQVHICYCHTPMRYAWDLYFDYLKLHRMERGIKGILIKGVMHKLRLWDLAHSSRVDHFIANSKTVAKRIYSLYKRSSIVIHPPVDTDFFSNDHSKKENYFITCSRLVPYKKIDLMVEAFRKVKDQKLLIAGDGPELKRLKSIAPPNVEFLGSISNESLRSYLTKAKAFIFMAHEDFGIAPVEAQSCGTAVIAFSKGGAKESVIDQKTGIFFDHQTPDALIDAIDKFHRIEDKFDIDIIQEHAKQFSKQNFREKFKAVTLDLYSKSK